MAVLKRITGRWAPQNADNAAMESYAESQDSYSALFEDKTKYNAIMGALAGVIYREMRREAVIE